MIILLLTIGTTAFASSNDDALQPHLERVTQMIKSFDGEIGRRYIVDSTGSYEIRQQGSKIKNSSHSIAKRDDDLFVHSTHFEGDAKGFVQSAHGLNSRYYFQLERNRRGDSWLLKSVIERNESPAFKENKGVQELLEERENLTKFLKQVTLLGSPTKPLDLPNLPGFKLIEAKLPDESSKLLVLNFERDVPNYTKSTANVTFDMEQFGLPVQIIEQYENQNQVRRHESRRTISRTDNGFMVKNQNLTHVTDGGKETYHSEIQGTVTIELRAAPEEDFTCSAFGVPEPPGLEIETRTPIYVWLILAAGLLFALALIIRRYALR